MNKSNLRIVNDIMDFNKNTPDDIYISFDKNDNAINNCLTHMITTSWLHQQSVQIKNINLKT